MLYNSQILNQVNSPGPIEYNENQIQLMRGNYAMSIARRRRASFAATSANNQSFGPITLFANRSHCHFFRMKGEQTDWKPGKPFRKQLTAQKE